MSSANADCKRRILIIDDDPDTVVNYKTILERPGYEVSVAYDGKTGLKLARQNKPDLIILDIMMEYDFAGYEVTQALKFGGGNQDSAIPILMISSIPLDPANRFHGAGEVEMITPDAYLSKPIRIDEFLATVDSLLHIT